MTLVAFTYQWRSKAINMTHSTEQSQAVQKAGKKKKVMGLRAAILDRMVEEASLRRILQGSK